MTARHRVAVVALVALLEASCASSTFGPRIARQAVETENYPKNGTPKDQVKRQWGPPNQYLKTSDGRDEWYYAHSWVRDPYGPMYLVPLLGLFFIRFDTDVWKVWITFDDQGRVAEANGTHLASH